MENLKQHFRLFVGNKFCVGDKSDQIQRDRGQADRESEHGALC